MSIEQQGKTASRPALPMAAAHGAGARPRSPVRRFMGKRITLVAILAVLAVLFLKDRELFEPSYEDIYQEYQLILTRTQELAERNAGDAEWAAFEEDALARLKPIADELLELCERNPSNQITIFGINRGDSKTALISRPLLHLGRNDLPTIISDARAGKPVDSFTSEVVQQMQKVRNALDAIRGGAKGEDDRVAQ